MAILASLIVLSASLFLIVLALTSIVEPDSAAKFLNGFASNIKVHLIEMCLRGSAGAALVVASNDMLFTELFYYFGWLLLITSAVLILIPWRWHHAYANVVVPPLTQRVWVFGVFSLPLGLFIGYSLLSNMFM